MVDDCHNEAEGMAPKKNTNTKVLAANEKKAAVQAEKNAKKAAEFEKQTAEEWSQGAKDTSKKVQSEAKRLEQQAKKLERESLLEAEESQLPSKAKQPARGAQKSAAKLEQRHDAFESFNQPEEFSASGLDAALDLMSLATSSEKSNAVAELERHPEKRMKAAYEAFEERELPKLRKEYNSLKLSQHKQMLQKMWKKSPENPMNQATVQYNAKRAEELEAINQEKERKLEEMRIKN